MLPVQNIISLSEGDPSHLLQASLDRAVVLPAAESPWQGDTQGKCKLDILPMCCCVSFGYLRLFLVPYCCQVEMKLISLKNVRAAPVIDGYGVVMPVEAVYEGLD